MYLLDTDHITILQRQAGNEWNFTLLTRNMNDFTRIPGLRVEDWTVL